MTLLSERDERTNELLMERMERSNNLVQNIAHASRLASDQKEILLPAQQRGVECSDKIVHRAGPRASKRSYRINPWFLSTMWEISLDATLHDFHLSIRSCNIVAEDSAIFALCRLGDLAGVRRLFSEGKASPRDCTYNPHSWLDSRTVLAVS